MRASGGNRILLSAVHPFFKILHAGSGRAPRRGVAAEKAAQKLLLNWSREV
jgi:hypothetical protein